MKLEDAIKEMSREELEYTLLDLNNSYLNFEQFLIKELGHETYIDLCKEFALELATNSLRSWGTSEDVIKEFEKSMGHEEKEKN